MPNEFMFLQQSISTDNTYLTWALEVLKKSFTLWTVYQLIDKRKIILIFVYKLCYILYYVFFYVKLYFIVLSLILSEHKVMNKILLTSAQQICLNNNRFAGLNQDIKISEISSFVNKNFCQLTLSEYINNNSLVNPMHCL